MSSTILTVASSLVDSSASDYTVETAKLDKDRWHDIIQRFDDASLMQTWSYSAARWGEGNLSHVLVKRNNEIVAAAQVVIKKVPLIGAGLAHVKWGPLWQLHGRQKSFQTLRRMLQALRNVYELRRGLLLRIFPAGTEDGTGVIRSIFTEEGLKRDLSIGTPTSAFIDLSHSLEELRRSLRPTWRRNLVLAERNKLTIQQGTSDELLEIFTKLYIEMLHRKKVTGVVSIANFREMQKSLPEPLKIRVMICEHQGEPIAGLAVPHLGNTAQNLLAATGHKGLDLRGSYLLHWRMLEWLKEHGCRWYDLDGVNHKAYPGISQFKLGFAGALGWEAEYLGQYESCTNYMSRLPVKLGENLLRTYGAVESAINGWRTSDPDAPAGRKDERQAG
jgi:lipid II:glycine glycyltransferase (peptidoglycan interpeptide bridge formation enzyme)